MIIKLFNSHGGNIIMRAFNAHSPRGARGIRFTDSFIVLDLAQQNHFRLCFRGHLPILRMYIFLNSLNSYLKTMVHPALPLRLRGRTMSVPDSRYVYDIVD